MTKPLTLISILRIIQIVNFYSSLLPSISYTTAPTPFHRLSNTKSIQIKSSRSGYTCRIQEPQLHNILTMSAYNNNDNNKNVNVIYENEDAKREPFCSHVLFVECG